MGLSVLRHGRRGEERDGEDIALRSGGYPVCAVFVSSSLVSSDGALAMGVVDLDSWTERMANS